MNSFFLNGVPIQLGIFTQYFKLALIRNCATFNVLEFSLLAFCLNFPKLVCDACADQSGVLSH